MSDQAVVRRSGAPAGEGPLENLLELVIQRLAVARDAAAVKYASGEPIDDPVREREILQEVACALNADGHCPQAGVQFFRDQIEANKAIQRGLHHRWNAHPEEVLLVPAGLAEEVRPKLDRINRQIIWQFARLGEVPTVSCGEIDDLVDERLSAAASARQLPRLQRAAALFAMRSLCSEAARETR